MINAVVFDMDDTLFDEQDYVCSGFAAVDRWLTEMLDVEGFYEMATRLFAIGKRQYVFNEALDCLNVRYNEYLINRLVVLYREHIPDIQLAEDAMWVLDRMHSHVRLGLISDGYYRSQARKVEALKLQLHGFQSIVLSDQYGRACWKPSHVPYEAVSKELGIPHSECVYIGDNAAKDFIGAKRLGWTTIQVKRHNGVYKDQEIQDDYRAHYEIGNLKELSEISELQHLFY